MKTISQVAQLTGWSAVEPLQHYDEIDLLEAGGCYRWRLPDVWMKLPLNGCNRFCFQGTGFPAEGNQRNYGKIRSMTSRRYSGNRKK